MMSPSLDSWSSAGKYGAAIILSQILLFPTLTAAHAPLTNKLERLDARISKSPADSALWIERARVYSDQGEFARARSDLDRADSLEHSTQSAFTRAVMLYRSGDLEKSLVELNRVLATNSFPMAALEYRARIHRDLGNSDAAILDFEALIAEQPNATPGYYLAVAKLKALDERRLEEALALLDLGIDQLGLIPQLQTYAVGLELRLGRTAAAIERQGSLRHILQESPDWKVEIGRLHDLNGQPEIALGYYQRAQTQLSDLRPTTARTDLASRLEVLRRQLGKRDY